MVEKYEIKKVTRYQIVDKEQDIVMDELMSLSEAKKELDKFKIQRVIK
jgi:hypothetical protein